MMGFSPTVWRRRGVAALLWACSFVLVCSAAAQTTADELARRHFEAGAAYLEQSEYEASLREFEKAYQLSGRAALLINIATVHERMSNLEGAIDALRVYLTSQPEGEVAETVALRLANLERRLEEQQAARRPEPEPDEAPPPQPSAASVQTEPAEPAAALPVADETDRSRIPAYVLFSVAGASAIGSVITGVVAAGEHKKARDTCSPRCPDAELATGRTLAITSTVLTGLAVVSGAVGAVFYFGGGEEEKPERRVEIGVGAAPGGAVARGRWRF